MGVERNGCDHFPSYSTLGAKQRVLIVISENIRFVFCSVCRSSSGLFQCGFDLYYIYSSIRPPSSCGSADNWKQWRALRGFASFWRRKTHVQRHQSKKPEEECSRWKPGSDHSAPCTWKWKIWQKKPVIPNSSK